MKVRMELNQVIGLEESDIDELITDLETREEFLCTGHSCAAEAEFI